MLKKLTLNALLPVLAALTAQAATRNSDKPLQTSGPPVPELAALDRLVLETMGKHAFPGGALAVVKNGRLVLARGYGLADPQTGKAVRPDSLFRIASLSKPVTAAVVLKLVESGKLRLEDRAIELLGDLKPLPGKQIDPRWRQITVGQLLHHTGGFDSSKSLDPMICSRQVAREWASRRQPDQRAITGFMLGRPLDFDPGAKYAYSNFGFCVLGRIIEKAAGKSYEEAARSLVLAPAGITRMRLAGTRLEERLPGEVAYQASRGDAPCQSVFSDVKEKVAAPYGLYYIGAMDAHGGWVASAVDMVRFVTAVNGSRKPGILKPESIRMLESPPGAPLPRDPRRYYGLGWNIVALDHGANWVHCGRLSGSASMMVRLESGVSWVALFNSDSNDEVYGELDRGMHKAFAEITNWPQTDQFPQFQ